MASFKGLSGFLFLSVFSGSALPLGMISENHFRFLKPFFLRPFIELLYGSLFPFFTLAGVGNGAQSATHLYYFLSPYGVLPDNPV